MVDIAQLGPERWVVAPEIVGSNPTIHPSLVRMKDSAKKRAKTRLFGPGNIWISSPLRKESKRVSAEELQAHLDNGWVRGRKMKW